MPKAISSEFLRKRKQNQQQVDNKSNGSKKKKTNHTFKTYCSVPNCGLISSNVGTFTIPKTNHVKAHWFNFLAGCGKIVDPQKNYKICERHFEAKFVMSNGTRKNIMFGGKPTLDAKLKRKLPFELEELNEENARSAERLKNKDESLDDPNESLIHLTLNVIKEEPLDIIDYLPPSLKEEPPATVVIQSFIKEEPLEIKQEIVEDRERSALSHSYHPEVEISSEPIKKEVQKTRHNNQTSRESLTDHQSTINESKIQPPTRLKYSENEVAIEQLINIFKIPRGSVKRKSKAIILAKPSATTNPLPIGSKKHIACFICHDKFSSQMTFKMHVKLMHNEKIL